MITRDRDGVAHIVALSGGHDSSALSFLLREREPRPYNYLCTPTGNELPAMFSFWVYLGERLGSPLIPIMGGSLKSLIEGYGALPNFRDRWCTRRLKIEPYRKFLLAEASRGPIVSYVGLRADEAGRAGGAYGDIPGVTMRFPLREWGLGEEEVQEVLAARGIRCPDRTDCAVCYHQRLGEWFELWRDNPDAWAEGEGWEASIGHTFRTPGRDTWPSDMKGLRLRFEAGDQPTISLDRMTRERMRAGGCRVCTL